jgi:hypothetical protein
MIPTEEEIAEIQEILKNKDQIPTVNPGETI